MKPRPQSVKGKTPRTKTGCGHLYLTVSDPEEEYREVLCKLGKSGVCPAAFLDGIGRLITFALNAGVPKDVIIKAFSGIRCPNPVWDGDIQVLSCLDGVAKILQREWSTVNIEEGSSR